MNLSKARRIIVAGDSVFDNEPYVGSGRPVASHLAELLPGWEVDFRALDGAICADVCEDQIDIKSDGQKVEALALSVGGNDALQHIGLLQDPTGHTFLATALKLGGIQKAFRADYQQVLRNANSHADRVIALTIYRPRYHLDGWPKEAIDAIDPLLSIFNDVIQEECRLAGVDVLDNRHVCTCDEDFANAIEPSDAGGRKIATAITTWISVA